MNEFFEKSNFVKIDNLSPLISTSPREMKGQFID
jgi:hypothetical protein